MGYIGLAAAILEDAIGDYRRELKASKMNGKMSKRASSLEQFFLSDWGQMLSFNHGEYIIETVRKEFK